MAKKTDRMCFSFRYLSLTKEQSVIISKELTNQNIIHDITKRKGFFVLGIDKIIEIDLNPELINKLNTELDIDRTGFDYVLTISCFSGMGGFTIPSKIIDFIRVVGGKSIELTYLVF